MTKMILLALLTLAVLTSEASAQSRSIYDDSGKLIGNVTTDSSGTVTFYDASGRFIIREVPIRRTDLYNETICGFAGPCLNPSEKFGGHRYEVYRPSENFAP